MLFSFSRRQQYQCTRTAVSQEHTAVTLTGSKRGYTCFAYTAVYGKTILVQQYRLYVLLPVTNRYLLVCTRYQKLSSVSVLFAVGDVAQKFIVFRVDTCCCMIYIIPQEQDSYIICTRYLTTKVFNARALASRTS